MGERAQIEIVQKPHSVFLYTHWGGKTVLSDTARGLLYGRDRWDDPEYLTRIIFDNLSRNAPFPTTGFGIGTCQHIDIDTLVTVNPDSYSIECRNFSNEKTTTWSFDELIENEGKSNGH